MNDELTRQLTGKEPSSVEPPRFRLIPAGTLKPRKLDWVISQVFERDSLVEIFGPPGASKTFQAIDMSLCVATGTDYHGRPVQQGPGVYVTGEGQNGLARRFKAWSVYHGIDITDAQLHVSTMPAALTDNQNLTAVMQAIEELDQPPVLVVFDTVARNMGPGDENSTQDMTAFVAACDQIRSAYQCAVLLVHHSGHNATERARGSSVLNGALDAAYRVEKSPDGIVTVECTKAKDFVPPELMAFKFESVELGFDNDDGTPATSAILNPTDAPDTQPRKPQGKYQPRALKVLSDLYRQQGRNLEGSDRDPDQARVLITDWLDASKEAGIPRNRWYEAKDALAKKGAVRLEPPYCKPVSGA